MKTQKSIYDARFLKEFTLAVLQTVETQKFNIPPTKEIIDADLVPELSEELLREYALNKEFLGKIRELDKSIEIIKESELKPITKFIPKKLKRFAKHVPQRVSTTDTTSGYQKIQPLLRDPSVSRIQCFAPNKPLAIIRAGQKQITRILLSFNQIKDIFQEISDNAHIPLVEGPFKIVLKDLTINGINSQVTNAKFIIQKQTAYSLLEEKRKTGSSHMMMRR